MLPSATKYITFCFIGRKLSTINYQTVDIFRLKQASLAKRFDCFKAANTFKLSVKAMDISLGKVFLA